jgi:hypothetical protein
LEKRSVVIEDHGIQCWIAPRDVTPGKNYGAAILDAIEECSVFVLILSSDSNKSGQVVREVERAASTDSIIIPVRVEEIQPSRNLKFYVSSAHWLDAVTKPFDKHLRELLKAIQNWEQSGSTKYDQTAAAPASSATASPVSPAVPPILPKIAMPRARLFVIVGATLAAVGLAALALYGLVRNKRKEAGPTIALQVTPSPSITIAPVMEPSPSIAETLAPPSFTPSPVPFEVPTATPSPITFASPVRRRPGEPFGAATRSPISSPSIAATPALENETAEPFPAAAPVIKEVAASSQLKLGNATRRPSLVFDGNPATAWVPKDDGVGESLSVHFKSPATITSVSILNSAMADEAHYRTHNRVHTL